MKKVQCIIIPIFVVLFTVSLFLLSCGTSDTVGDKVGTFIMWFGELSGPPSNPELHYAYYNTTDGCIYVWNGDSWEFLVPPATLTYVPKTGQTTLYATGDDGDLEKGVAWPSPRFTENGDGTVTDNLTELIWLQNANRSAITQNWSNAVIYCNSLADDGVDLTDGSVAGDWRLPNIKELMSLIDYGRYNPALTSGHPFTGVQSGYYWSSTTYASSTAIAFVVYPHGGHIYSNDKTNLYYVWPVRGGK